MFFVLFLFWKTGRQQILFIRRESMALLEFSSKFEL